MELIVCLLQLNYYLMTKKDEISLFPITKGEVYEEVILRAPPDNPPDCDDRREPGRVPPGEGG